MKKTILSLFIMISFCSSSVFAQNGIRSTIDKPNRENQLPKSELSFGFGIKVPNITMEIMSINIAYSYNVYPNLYAGATLASSWQSTNYSRVYVFTPILHAKYNWLNAKNVSLYSRIGAGMNIQRQQISLSDRTIYKLAYQISPLGLEVGDRVMAFYFELGYGYMGIGDFGHRFRF